MELFRGVLLKGSNIFVNLCLHDFHADAFLEFGIFLDFGDVDDQLIVLGPQLSEFALFIVKEHVNCCFALFAHFDVFEFFWFAWLL